TSKLDEVQPQEMIHFLQEVEKKVLAYDPRVTKVNANQIQKQTMEKAIYHNKGLALSEKNNFLFVIISLLVEENGELKSGMHFEVTKDFTTLTPDEVSQKAVEKGLSMLGERSYPNKNYPVVLENQAAASLLATFTSSFSAQAVQDGQSRLKGKLGEMIGAEKVTLVDRSEEHTSELQSRFDL